MTITTAPAAGPAPLEVRPLTGPDDRRDAELLLAEQRRWLASIGIDVTAAQPDSSGDYADPAAYYAPPDGALLIARLGGRPVGLVALRRLVGARRAGELRRMFVLDSARGCGAGRRLLDAAVTAARRLGFTELWLETVPEHMATAFRLYTTAGFRPARPLGHTALPGVLTMRMAPGSP